MKIGDIVVVTTGWVPEYLPFVAVIQKTSRTHIEVKVIASNKEAEYYIEHDALLGFYRNNCEELNIKHLMNVEYINPNYTPNIKDFLRSLV